MEIYLLRHGIADDPRPGQKDADRALTSEGKKKLRIIMQIARDAGLRPQVILTSPYRRALESARIAAEVLKHEDALVESRALTPMADPQSAWDDIRLHSDAESVLAVTHEPLCGLLIAHLCATPSLHVDVKKGSITRIDLPQAGMHPRGTLKWLLTPRLAGAD